jgi:hypothetical protein
MGIIAASRLRDSEFPSAGIIHRYNFNETSGNISNDLVGTENGIIRPGVVLGEAGFKSGDLAYKVPAQDNAWVEHDPFLTGFENFSIYLRIKDIDRSDNKDKTITHFCGWAGTSSFIIRSTTGSSYQFTLITNIGRVDLDFFRNETDGEWTELVCTYDGTKMTGNSNRGEIVEASHTGVLNTSNYYQIGNLLNMFNSVKLIDELIIWDRALNQEEQSGTFIL